MPSRHDWLPTLWPPLAFTVTPTIRMGCESRGFAAAWQSNRHYWLRAFIPGGPCCNAVKEVINSMEWVTRNTAKFGRTTFVVTGRAESGSLIKVLDAAGFSARVEQ
jgi:hypothetical protein